MSKTITSKQAAEILGYSVSYVTTHLLQTSTIQSEKVNGRWAVDLESVQSYVPPTNTRPQVKRGRILPIKKDVGNKEETRAIQEQIEAARKGKIKPLVLERGVSSVLEGNKR